jgi:hypothetical protein
MKNLDTRAILNFCLMWVWIFLIEGWGGVQFGILGTAATNRPIVPAPDDYDVGGISGMVIGRGNRSTRRKRGPVPLCQSQNPRAAGTRTWASGVGSQRLTAWATARPCVCETWSCAVRKGHSFSIFEEWVLSRILIADIPKEEELMWGCRKLHKS